MRAYANLDIIKDRLEFDTVGDDGRVRTLIEAVTRDVDGYCNRSFGPLVATRYFSGNGKGCLLLPWDLIAITTLKEDEDRDGTFETTWATTDYELAPYDNDPTGQADLETTRPYWAIEVNERSNGDKSSFPRGQKRFEVVGKFGYNESTVDSGSLLSGALDDSSTTVTVDDGSDFHALQTILVDSEQMYVTDISGNDLTVDRGVNGTTAASHADNATVSILEVPSQVREAVVVETVRRWQMERADYASQTGSVETGEVRLLGGGLRHVTMEMLGPYRRLTVH